MRLGPRNRRRLAIGSVIAGAIVAVVVAVLLTRSTTNPGHAVSVPRGHGLPASGNQCVPTSDGGCVFNFYGVAAGMTTAQVRHLIGKPATRRGRCWQYPTQLSKAQVESGVVRSVLDVCFFGGRVSDRSTPTYVRRDGKVVLLHG